MEKEREISLFLISETREEEEKTRATNVCKSNDDGPEEEEEKKMDAGQEVDRDV